MTISFNAAAEKTGFPFGNPVFSVSEAETAVNYYLYTGEILGVVGCKEGNSMANVSGLAGMMFKPGLGVKNLSNRIVRAVKVRGKVRFNPTGYDAVYSYSLRTKLLGQGLDQRKGSGFGTGIGADRHAADHGY